MLIRDGPRQEVMRACAEYVRALGPCGGYTLLPGGDMLPGTAPQRVEWMVQASCEAA